jgi:hypothetical protein
VQGFTKSLAMTVLSEIGDKTFFAAAVRRRLPAHLTAHPFSGSSSCPFSLALPASRLRAPGGVCVRVRARVRRRYRQVFDGMPPSPGRGGVPPCSALTRFRDEIVADSAVERAGWREAFAVELIAGVSTAQLRLVFFPFRFLHLLLSLKW